MEISLTGKRALVTGAAQGIGLAVAKKLSACGAQIVALDVQEKKLKEAMKEIPGAESFAVDLSDWDSIEKVFKSIRGVELVVNNAGVNHIATLKDMQGEVVASIMNVNLKGAMAICKHVINDWTSSETRGAIVNIASIAASRPFTDFPVYCESKAGLLQYTRCLALDCAPKGIRVNAVSPGTVNTEMSRAGLEIPEVRKHMEKNVPMVEKILDPEDIANAVAFLLCDKVAGKITGVNLHVDAGYALT